MSPQAPAPASSPSAAVPLFGAFLEQRRTRRAPVAAVLAACAATVALFKVATIETGFNVITPYGVKTVKVGMTTAEVNSVLGRPWAPDHRGGEGGSECYRYGRLTMEAPSFVVYSVCYEQAKLRDVTEQRFSAWQVSEDGQELAPPGASSPPAPQ